MTIERTLSIIKPDAVAKNVIGQIYARFEAAGLKIAAARFVQLSRADAEAFYGKGLCFQKTGLYEQAIDCYNKSIALNPNYVDSLYNMGNSLESLNKY